jgi:hypothetical protein
LVPLGIIPLSSTLHQVRDISVLASFHMLRDSVTHISVMSSGMILIALPVQFERAVFATGGSLRINLPSPITQALQIKEGDTLTVTLNDHQIIMEKNKKGKS